MGWLGGIVFGIIVGWFAQAWWTDHMGTRAAKRGPSWWLRRKDDGRLYRRDGDATERDGKERDMVILYDCETKLSELWPKDEVHRAFRVVENPEAP